MYVYNNASLEALSHKPFILSPLDNFLEDLEPLFYGRHFPSLVRKAREDHTIEACLDSDVGLLGMLKDSLRSNHTGTYNVKSWEKFGIVL